ncbi:MAG: hypothetical protein U0414_10740 [Polyangiaceae bacterium]
MNRLRAGVVPALLAALAGCGEASRSAGASASATKPGGSEIAVTNVEGFANVDEALAAFGAATKLAESTWPGAKLGGVRVSDEVPSGGSANAYALRVSYEFEADPADPTARSGSIVCAPACAPIRHKVKRAPAPALPCAPAAALAAARAEGLRSTRPLVAYGYWNVDERAGWTFRDGEAVIEIGRGCRPPP